MGADEEATLKTFGECREIVDGLIAWHAGRIFGAGGDGVNVAARQGGSSRPGSESKRGEPSLAASV